MLLIFLAVAFIIVFLIVIFSNIDEVRSEPPAKIKETPIVEDTITIEKVSLVEDGAYVQDNVNCIVCERGEPSERDLKQRLINECNIDPRNIYHDLYLKRPDGKYCQIDLVVTLSQGIVIIEVKDYSGWIFGKEINKYWTKVLAYGKEKYRFYNPILQNKSHIKALKSKLKYNPYVPIFSVVVFYGNCVLKSIEYKQTIRTNVIYPTMITDIIKKIKSQPKAMYGNKREIMSVLTEAVKNGENADIVKKHQEYVKNIINKPNYL